MLDIKLLRSDPELIERTLAERAIGVFEDIPVGSKGWSGRTVERLAELDLGYRDLLRAQEDLRQRQNQSSQAMREVSRLPGDEQAAARASLKEEGRVMRDRERELASEMEAARVARDEAWSRVPNLTHPDAPRGYTDEDNRELRRWGDLRDFGAEGIEPKDHVALGESLGILDFESGARVAGQKFYYLKNDLVLLDLALQRHALEVARSHGFVLHTTPDLARAEILSGLGFNPRGESTQVYSVADTDLCLVGTAEITLGGMLADQILDEDALPLMFAGLSHCFRTEAGAAGKESKGLYRVHQFTKVELFAFTPGELEASQAMHEKLVAVAEEIYQGLEIPYRVVEIATGDLGGPAFRKYDLEAWMPGRGSWGEITSTSNCTDYQARRLRIRYRSGSGKKGKNRLVHMLNGTAVACSRAIVAILENYQQADGSVAVPKVLRPMVGRDLIAAGEPRR